MRRERRTREPRSIDEEDPVAGAAEERCGDGSRDPGTHDEDVTFDLHRGSV
jgi:hypothetical protein